jgi:hypothetical protein
MTEPKFVVPIVKTYLEDSHRDGFKPDYHILCEKGVDVLEVAIDTFSENPTAFALLAHRRHPGLVTDVFAARVCDRQPSGVVTDFRSVLPRERTYDHEDDYSIPIGSRYHPERAQFWEVNSPIESTEEWLGSR